MTWPAVALYVAAAVLLSAGCWWFSPGAGLICGGVCVAILTTLLVLEVGEGVTSEADRPTDPPTL